MSRSASEPRPRTWGPGGTPSAGTRTKGGTRRAQECATGSGRCAGRRAKWRRRSRTGSGRLSAMAPASRPFGYLLTAMVTPMAADGSVDIDAGVALARHLVDHGHDGLVLNGTTGEAPTTHAPEKAELVRAVVEAVGDRAVIVAGAGSNDTAHAVRMAEQAAEAGAHGVLVVTPYYSGDDVMLLPYLSVGAVGLVSMTGHLAGEGLAEVIRAFHAGDVVGARAGFTALLPVVDLICGSGNGALRAKAALALLGLIPTATMRLPQVGADEAETAEVRAALVAAGLLD